MHGQCVCVKVDDVFLCSLCGRTFPISEDDLASIGNDLTKVHRRCVANADDDTEYVSRVQAALTATGETQQSLGLGDLTAKALESVGITKERWSAWWGAPCDCDKRQEKLNQVGRKIVAFLRGD